MQFKTYILASFIPHVLSRIDYMNYPTIEECIGSTPLVRLQRLQGDTNNTILLKLEGNNPAGSVKDRPALSMIRMAESRGVIKPGDTLIEATSGNTGIALAMAAAIKGYRMILVMPENMSLERRSLMKAYGAEIVLTSEEGSMEAAIDKAREMEAAGEGVILDQFSNQDNPLAHIKSTGPEIWQQTDGKVTHIVSSMGTTGTIMGLSTYLKEKNPDIEIVGVQPEDGSSIPGIRRWPLEYLPKIYDASRVDRIIDVSQEAAESTTRQLAATEGVMAGISSGGAVSAALELSKQINNSVIVVIVCDRGDRYLSTGVFPA
jgi:cysteine synthase B